MSQSRTVIIIGCRGALGTAISRRFLSERWRRVLVGVSPCNDQLDSNSVYVNLADVHSPKVQYDMISDSLKSLSKASSPTLDAVVNVSGGFCMDSANVRFQLIRMLKPFVVGGNLFEP